MKFIDIKQVHRGKFLSYYIGTYLNSYGKIKEYELICRDSDLTKETFENNIPAGVGLVALNEAKDKVLLQAEFRLATKRFVYNFPAGLIDNGKTQLRILNYFLHYIRRRLLLTKCSMLRNC